MYKKGDIIEQVVEPLSYTSRGGICSPCDRWYFHLWRAEVIETDLCGNTKFNVLKSVILQPDDPRVIEHLRKHYTPSDYEIQKHEEKDVPK